MDFCQFPFLLLEFPVPTENEERPFELKTLALFASVAGYIKCTHHTNPFLTLIARNFPQAAATLLVVFPTSYSPFETIIEKYLDSIYDQQKDKIIDAMLLAVLWVKHTSTNFKFIEAYASTVCPTNQIRATKVPTLDAAATLIGAEHNFSSTHPYFKALVDGTMTKEQFASSQSGFYFAVEVHSFDFKLPNVR